MLSCLLDSWVSLGHFPCARERAVLRIACQYILALHSVAVSPSQPPLCASSPLLGGLMNAGLRLPPPLRQQHVALRLWLGRDHPSNLSVVPDVLRPDGEGARARDARAFVSFLQQDLGVMLELPAVAQRL